MAFQRQTYVTTRDYNNRLEQRRAQESHNNNLERYHETNTRWTANHRSDQRVETKRRLHRMNRQQEEMAMVENYERQERERREKAVLREQDEKIAAALQDMKTKQQAGEAESRRICEESEELKQLKLKLRTAQISKMRSTQLQEAKLIQQQNFSQDRAMDEMMEKDRQLAQEKEYQEQQRQFFRKMQSKGVLQNQIKERAQRKREAYEAFLREKAMVDQIVKGIEAEDRAKMMAHKNKQRELQDNIRNYLQEREVWREQEKKRAEEELRKMQEYNALQVARQQQILARKQGQRDREDEVLAKLTAEIESKRREEQEMRALLDELYQEEAEQKALERARMDKQKQDQMRAEIKLANEQQKQYKAERAKRQQEEEEAFRQQMIEKFAADQRLEQMNENRKRREMANYRQEVERLVEERRAMYEASVQAELEEQRAAEAEEQHRKQVVEQERQRLLREHAADLKEFLPKGVLKDDRDFETVYGKAPERHEEYDELGYITGNRTGPMGAAAQLARRQQGDHHIFYDDRPQSRPVSGRRSANGRNSRGQSDGNVDWFTAASAPVQQRIPSAGRRRPF